jgi:hypothetical protein
VKQWRWFLVSAGTLALIHAAGTNNVTYGLLLADVCAIFWAARVHVILEPRWSIDDELSEIQSWM